MEDARWVGLTGGYRTLYDPRPALAELRSGDTDAWDELWSQLHHQYDVRVASYDAVPILIDIHRKRDVADWNTYALIGTVEQCREREGNSPMPDWLEAEYRAAWRQVTELGCRDLLRAEDRNTLRSILGAIAIAKGLQDCGRLLLNYTEDEIEEVIERLELGD